MQIAKFKSPIPCGLANRIERFGYKQVLITGNQVTRRQDFLQLGCELLSLYFHAAQIRAGCRIVSSSDLLHIDRLAFEQYWYTVRNRIQNLAVICHERLRQRFGKQSTITIAELSRIAGGIDVF